MKHTIEFNVDDPPSVLFKQMRDGLAPMRATTRQPKTLEWQLRLYDFVLSRPDPDQAARTYWDARKSARSFRDSLIQGARAVGFIEPIPEANT